MHLASTAHPFSDALRKLVLAARALGADHATRKVARAAVGRRFAVFLGGLVKGPELATLTLVSETKAYEYLDPQAAKAGLRVTELPLLDPARFRAAIAWAIETHRAVWGEELLPATREQAALLVLTSMNEAEGEIAKALMGDLRIDDAEARGMTPKLLAAYRQIRKLLITLGVDPDETEASEGGAE